MSLRIACVGGGPGGLFLASLLMQSRPDAQVTVFERNRADDTFGFGVVFSDATLAAIHAADPVLLDALRNHGRHWDEIEVRLQGERHHIGGNGMAAIVRKTLLGLLQERATEVGADLRFEHEVRSLAEVADYDLVVLADGANSSLRDELADDFQPSYDEATAKFIWFGTSYAFDGLTFLFENSRHGTFAVHGYPISDSLGTFIVETDESSWRAAGLDEFDTSRPPGRSDEKSKGYLERLFAEQIDGHKLLVNNSRWGNFRTRRAGAWSTGNVVLLGDSAHTAHFSVGSGTKMAMEDAIALSESVNAHPADLGAALKTYESSRRHAVDRIQASARPSLSWWENFGRYHDAFTPSQFAFHFMTRSIGRAKWQQRDEQFVATIDQQWQAEHGTDPLDTPLQIGDDQLAGRTVRVERTARGRDLVGHDRAGEPVRIPLVESHDTAPAAWGLWLAAPEAETGLPDAVELLRSALPDNPCAVAVHGGTSLTRALLAEEARIVHEKPALVIEDEWDEDRFATLVLSGRADLVGTVEGPHAGAEHV